MEPHLSRQETRVVQHLALDGAPNKIIAHDMGIRTGTVKVYITSTLRKLRPYGINNRVGLALWGAKHLNKGEIQ